MSFTLTLEVKCPSDWNEDYEHLVMAVLNHNTFIDAVKIDVDAPLLLAEVKKLRKQLSEAEDVIQVALDHADDEDKVLFEDFLEGAV